MDNPSQNWDEIVRVESNGHLAEGKILQHLIKDMIQDQGGYPPNGDSVNNVQTVVLNNNTNTNNNNNSKTNVEGHERELSNNEQLQTMIENYRNHVIKQRHQNPKMATQGNYSQNRAYSTAATTSTPNGNEASAEAGYNVPGGGASSLMSHSQPCLFSSNPNGEHSQEDLTNDYSHFQHLSDPRDENNLIHSVMANQQANSKISLINNNNETILLRNEIAFLKKQLDLLQKKTDKLSQLESAYGKIEQDFEQVLAQREKQEKLEKSALLKMEQQIQKLGHENELLQEENGRLSQICLAMEESSKSQTTQQQQQLENIPQQILAMENNGNLNADQQIHQLNLILSEVLPKNKELMALQERLKIECEAQSTTLEEQRTHIEMLEKALANAQERIAAKDRQAVDAVAIVDKCSHLQKLLQEALDDKQKRVEEHNKQKAQLEMELAQLRMQIAKDHSNFGPRKGAKSPENEEIVKLKKTIYSKDERISQLENSLLEIQKRYNEELQRNDSMVLRCESDALIVKLRNLELEKSEKERRIQELLDEKQRIHGQWADERHSLDHRVRLLEQDLRHLVSQSSLPYINGAGSGGSGAASPLLQGPLNYAYTPSNTLFYGPNGDYFMGPAAAATMNSPIVQRGSNTELPTSVRAAVLHDSTMARMEELRRKMADRRASSGSWASSARGASNANKTTLMTSSRQTTDDFVPQNHLNSSTSGSKSDSKTSSNTSLHSRTSSASDMLLNPHKRTLTANPQHNPSNQQLNNYLSNYPPGIFNGNNTPPTTLSNGNSNVQSSASPTPSRMNSHMPDPYSSSLYIDSLPAASRRRFAAASERVSHPINGVQSRSASQAPPPPTTIQQQNIAARTAIRERSADARAMLFRRNRGGESRADGFTNHQRGTTTTTTTGQQQTPSTGGPRDRSADSRGIFTRANVNSSVEPRGNHLKRHNLAEQQAAGSEKPPSGSNSNPVTPRNNNNNNNPLGVSSTTVVEVNRDHLKVEELNRQSKTEKEGFTKAARRSSLGSFSSTGEN